MIPRIWLPIAIFVAGVAAMIAAVVTGEAEVQLVVIFPVFTGSSLLFLLGILLIILSFVVGFAMLLIGARELSEFEVLPSKGELNPDQPKKSQYGGVVLIGPVPIAFGSDKKIALFMLVLGIVVFIVLLGILILFG